MTMHSEVDNAHKTAASRNILNVVLGDKLFKTWYPSFYPEELVGRDLDKLFVCQSCFRYSKEVQPYLAHISLCQVENESLPGRLIYSKEPYSIYELDGEDYKLFTQNLSLFAKLFLDNKSVFFDVSSFNYYLLIYQTASGDDHRVSQIIGFFSKEKMSWDNNNLACILVFPPWQRRGLGKKLMGVSYELSKREGRVGGPEKPLSDLGKKGYISFWQARVANAVLATKAKLVIDVEELAALCWMLVEDVVVALKEMGVLETRKKGKANVVVNKVKVKEWATVNNIDLNPPIDENGFTQDWVLDIREEI